MRETIYELLLTAAITGFILYVIWLVILFIDNRARFRVTCECGHRERAYSLSSAKWAASTHMLACRGKCIVSPTPRADIAKAEADA